MALRDPDCVALLQWACPRLGLRWKGFRNVRGQVCKRIGRRMTALGLGSVEAYRERLERDPSEWIELDAACRVTISRFYRDHAVFIALGERWLPELAQRAQQSGRPLRCWSLGCASGEEPYSLALVLHFQVRPRLRALQYELVATDADAQLLSRAQRGCYPPGTLAELPRSWAEEAFEVRDTQWCLKPEHREGIRFVEEDLRRTLQAGPFDVILCRNVVFTYIAREAQLEILRSLHERLAEGGLLVIGAHERLPDGAGELVAPTEYPLIFQRR